MSMSSILATYKAKDEGFFTALGSTKDSGLKLLTGYLMDVAAEKKHARIERNRKLTPEQIANRKAKRDARRAELKAALKQIREAKILDSTKVNAAKASTAAKVAKVGKVAKVQG
jgi:uncharacterized protein YaiL (DUF2058 family)